MLCRQVEHIWEEEQKRDGLTKAAVVVAAEGEKQEQQQEQAENYESPKLAVPRAEVQHYSIGYNFGDKKVELQEKGQACLDVRQLASCVREQLLGCGPCVLGQPARNKQEINSGSL